MTDPLRARLAALIAEWREAAGWEADHNSNYERAGTLNQCADDAEAALLVARTGEVADVARRVRQHDTTIGTLISWIAQSANSPLRRDEAAQLLRMLEGAAPEEPPSRQTAP